MSPEQILGEDGAFARNLNAFTPRMSQQTMANAVDCAISEDQCLIVEAGTGTGKTFAYLVPSVMSGKKVVISTGTRNLQDQLFKRDIPLVCEALGVSTSSAILKGRTNYLCRHKLRSADQAIDKPWLDLRADLNSVQQFALSTKNGDTDEIEGVDSDTLVWSFVTANSDQCLGQECPDFNDCYLLKARRKAQAADIVVVNHHLFFADVALRDNGFGEVVPVSNVVVFDEAHLLPDVATQFLGTSVSGNQIIRVLKDVVDEVYNSAADLRDVVTVAKAAEKSVKDFRIILDSGSGRSVWGRVARQAAVSEQFLLMEDKLNQLSTLLETAAVRSKEMDQCWSRCATIASNLSIFGKEPPQNHVLWLETTPRSFVLNASPIDVSTLFQSVVQAERKSWVFTSATLTTEGHFEHFKSQLGLTDATTLKLETPFDYRNNSLLYLPPNMPEPSNSGFNEAFANAVIPVLEASRGRAFILFTSYSALRYMRDFLSDRADFTLFVQGEQPRSKLIDQFKQTERAVLLGTSSFWQGIDVQGDALSCVIIDKLPFASPSDPVLSARIDWMREQGASPFMDYQLPMAIISLKQGLGRLIRGIDDRGLMMIGDPRIVTKRYGQSFLDSLPDVPVSKALQDVVAFYDNEA